MRRLLGTHKGIEIKSPNWHYLLRLVDLDDLSDPLRSEINRAVLEVQG